MLINFLSALALVFVFEGLFPFSFPQRWKHLLQKIITREDKVVRIMGFFSMIVGVIFLSIVHQFAE